MTSEKQCANPYRSRTKRVESPHGIPVQSGKTFSLLSVFWMVERRTPLRSRQWLLPAVATATGPSHQDSTRSSNHGEGKSKNLDQRCKKDRMKYLTNLSCSEDPALVVTYLH
ncbi:hypothetical protein TNCV_3892281 [Trichonephila clavipes]|nr:hypothetical protein TNCV_3892281 [Trichonephila clavipes]